MRSGVVSSRFLQSMGKRLTGITGIYQSVVAIVLVFSASTFSCFDKAYTCKRMGNAKPTWQICSPRRIFLEDRQKFEHRKRHH